MPVVTHKGGETGGALGAARLACLAAGNRWLPSVKNQRSGRPGAPRLNAITF
jgi:hypothetical protein